MPSGQRQHTLHDELSARQRDLLAVLDTVGPGEWDTPSPNAGWTVRDLLVHLTTAEAGFVPTLRRMAAGDGGVPRDFDPNRWNAGQIRRRADDSPGALRAELTRAHEAMLELLETLDDAALDQRGWMSSGQEGSTEDNFRLVGDHKRAHIKDIQAALSATRGQRPAP